MNAHSVIHLWEMTRDAALTICIDGGWAVDALLGEQTRPHGDLDIALPAGEVRMLRALLATEGFVEVPRRDSWEHNFVLEAPDGRILDVHSYELHPDGTNRVGVPYRADHLSGAGTIEGTRVRCVPPEHLVGFHTGYDIDETDWHDVRLLCARFDLSIPDAYARFRKMDEIR